ncbi:MULTISPECIES: ribosome biogenesis GTPase Der [Oribacterium]|uniref:GTPase Der n=2 Tax=Oribacterium sinus TaxID=237576 RepID=C2KVU5_9FIRM|nr:ribosome biogenesis GTPase Der [Oribacterium sinus]EEJ52102.1 ribosome biogenesis GTPase Der [Oribacterium sinus F0268]MBB6041424.1 GTP-binding protein [Oribacterium sinus]MBF1306016.1 ribosome biogenesis GTPase Der [Oribacterium sinus]
MRKVIVAVVGRPNVGKSTLFNTIAGKQISIVQDTPGVTRDRIYAEGNWLNYYFTMVDTGGIEPISDDVLLKQMRSQAELAIETADVIIFVTDVKSGVVDADYEVAEMLRRSKKPIVLCVNKVDSIKKYGNDIYEFYQLGLGEPFPVSAANHLGLGDLLDEVVKHFPKEGLEEEEDGTLKIALIGKPNVGKSSLTNKLLGENRVIVSDIAGTTRDAIDTEVTYNGTPYIFIDTAGLRRKGKVTEDIERYSVIRTVAAVDRADICIVLIDAVEGITDGDTRIAGIAHESGKGVIIAVNKWDLVEKNDKTMQEFTKQLKEKFAYMDYAEYLFISAETGQRIHKIYELVNMIHDNQVMRIKTGVLNEILARATAMKQPPSDKGKRLKLFYITQASVAPPTFVIFVNDRELMHFSYTRYIENQIRENFGFRGTPIRFIIRERGED